MSRPGSAPVRLHASKKRSDRVRSILATHFGFRRGEVERYLACAARREQRKITEIENAVIGLACDLS